MFELFMALRYLRRHKVVYLSILGVMVGLVTLVVTSSVMGGFSRDIRARIRGMQSHLLLSKIEADMLVNDYPALLAEIRKVPHVVSAAPRIEQPAWLGAAGRGELVTVVGIDLREENETSDIARFFRQGGKRKFSLEYDDDRPRSYPGAVVGTEMRRRIFGSKFSVTTFRPGSARRPYYKDFEPVGTFRTGMLEYDKGILFASLKDVQEWLEYDPGHVSHIAINVDDYARHGEETLGRVLDVVHRLGGCSRPGDHAELRMCGLYRVRTWEQVKENLLRAVSIEKGLTSVLLFFIILVAGFNIVAIFSLMVMAKVRDIGIMRAFGEDAWGIARIFLLSGLVCGVVGSLLGIIAGLKVSYVLNSVADGIEATSLWLAQFARENPNHLVCRHALPLGLGIGGLCALVLLLNVRYWRTLAVPRALLLGVPWCGILFLAGWGLAGDLADRVAPESAMRNAILWIRTGFGWIGAFFLAAYALAALLPGARWPKLRDQTGTVLLATSVILAAAGLIGIVPREDFFETFFGHYVFDAVGIWTAVAFARSHARAWRESPSPSLALLFAGVVCALAAVGLSSFLANPPPLWWRGWNLFPKDVYYLDRIPTLVDYEFLGQAVILTLVVSILASIYPAFRAARFDPVEAIRRE